MIEEGRDIVIFDSLELGHRETVDTLRSVSDDVMVEFVQGDLKNISDTRDGTCVRDYIDVRDLIEAHILALRYLESGGGTDYFNLGTNDGSTVREVFSECEAVVGSKIPVEECARRPGDPATLIADNRKAKDVLGWEPRYALRDSVETAWSWERSMDN